MGYPTTALQRLRLVLLVLILCPAVFVAAYLVSTRATFRARTTHVPATPGSPPGTAGIHVAGVPEGAYAAVNPALIPALAAISGYTPPDPLAAVVEGVPPLGVYLPATGDTQFKLPPPTPTPALTPLPTSTSLPTPTPAEAFGIITPGPATFVSPDGVVGPAPLDFGGTDCAPAGRPVEGVLTQYYHWYHRGIDLGVPLNTPVVATHSARVAFAGWRTDGYGNLVILENGPFITYYGHLTDFNVSEGQLVGRGTVIGWSGSTGNSSGPHVHYEIRINDQEVDPLTFESRGYPPC